MSTLLQLLEDRNESFIAAVTASSDSEVLIELGQVWTTSTDSWAIRQFDQYLPQAISCRGHEGLLRQLLKSGEEYRHHQLMASLFVTFDRAIRRRPVDNSAGHLITSRRHKTVHSAKTLGWFRRRVWNYFQRLSEQDAAAYAEVAALTLSQYLDEDFATGENIVDNRSLMKLCFHGSPLVTFGPVHASLTHDSSVNNLVPSPWAVEVWSNTDAVRHLIELSVRAPARFVRWWAATVFCDELNEEPVVIGEGLIKELVICNESFLIPVCQAALKGTAAGFSADTWLTLIDESSPQMHDALMNAFMFHANTPSMPDHVLLNICRNATLNHSSHFIAQTARCLHRRRDTIAIPDDLVPFMELVLQTPGCNRLRGWVAATLLSHATSSEDAARRQVGIFARLLTTMSTTAKLDIIRELLVARSNSPVIAAAIGQACPEIRIDTHPQ